MDIEANLNTYLGARKPTGRYASFDYCFNYFQRYRENDRLAALAEGPSMQISCLNLGFYLASWGMLRGSSMLLRRSVKYFEPVVNVIVGAPSEVWRIDADNYSTSSWSVLDEVSRRIRTAFPEGASDILVTKVMLGVFGCVPAFDTYFKKGFGVSTFGLSALQRVERFYRENAEIVERHRVQTLDFDTGTQSNRPYTRAKVIDMIFFVEGAP